MLTFVVIPNKKWRKIEYDTDNRKSKGKDSKPPKAGK
jgi:hypothetical protein